MSADYCQSAANSPALAFDSVRIEQRAVIIRPMKVFGFLLHDAHIGWWNIELPLRVVIGVAFKQSLSGAERKRNEMMKHDGVLDCDRRDDDYCSENERRRITQALPA